MIFAFDPRREAIFLVAGDKSGAWQVWYRTAVRLADERFTEHPRRHWDRPDRIARRAQMRADMLASVSGAQLAEIRKQLGITQAHQPRRPD